jgi:hypothetical protein
MTGGDDIVGAGFDDLIELLLSVTPALFGIARLECATAAAAAEIIGAVGDHIYKIFLSDNRFDDKPKIVKNFVGADFPSDVAGILHGELDLAIFVPIGADLQLALLDPLCVKLNDTDKFKGVGDVVFPQSFQD